MITSGQAERSYPFACGVLAAGLAAFLVHKIDPTVGDSVKDLFSSAINVGAIATGFLGTMQSILLTSERRRMVEYLKEAHKFDRLVDYLLGAISLCITVALFSGIVLFLTHYKAETWYHYLLAVWAGMNVWAVSSCYRAFSIMSTILKS